MNIWGSHDFGCSAPYYSSVGKTAGTASAGGVGMVGVTHHVYSQACKKVNSVELKFQRENGPFIVLDEASEAGGFSNCFI